jgi:hypothetical protein
MRSVETRLSIVVYISVILVSLTFASASDAGIAPESIVGLWLFDKDEDDVAVDSSGNGLDGNIEGDAGWEKGVFGNALVFDGVGVRVVVPYMGNMEKESGSIVLWVYADFEVDDSITYGQIGIGGHYGDGLGAKDEKCHQIFKWGGNNNWFFRVGFDDPNDGVGANQFATPQDLMPDGVWTHAAMTWEKGGQSLVYINGEKVGTLSGNTKTLTEWRQEQILIGTSWDNQKHKGLMDEVGLFNVALSQGDIENIMADGMSFAVIAVDPADKLAATWGNIKANL